jgi:hypothetical protein
MAVVSSSWARVVALCPLLAGCPAPVSEPPPPPAKLEIASAPPQALGARAGGTDAAPRPDQLPTSPGLPLLPSPGLGGPMPDGGAPAPDAGGAGPTPDPGMAL